MGNIGSIHDTFIRAIMADTSVAADYFRTCLPPAIADKLDFTTLRQTPDSYVSRDLKKSVSDIVYTCQLTKGSRQVKISLLIEHKSSPDRYTPVQLGGYLYSAFLKQISNKEELSPVIPVLLYHGKRRWDYLELNQLFPGVGEDWMRFLPNFQYVYHDLGEIPDESVEEIGNQFLVASLLALKHSFEKEWLAANVSRLLLRIEGVPENLQSGLVVYLFERSGLSEQKVIEIINDLPLGLKNRIMYTSDVFIEKGKRIGFQEGMEKGTRQTLEKMVLNLIRTTLLNDEQIAAAAEITPEKVAEIRKTL